jgi:cytochrome c553
MKLICRYQALGLQYLLLLVAVSLSASPGIAVAQSETARSELEALHEQVEDLSRLAVRTQSHIMVDVEYHFSNLWFAGRNEQWDLASFYLRETDSHLGWTVRVRPVRSIRGGGSVDLQPFQQSIEQSGFAQLESAIEQKDAGEFEAAYRRTLTQCYACHQAAGLGYLQPHIPEMPLSSLMLQPK